jgi:hypothetical protein
VAGLALLFFLWGIVKYIFAQGNETAKVDGKNIMLWGLIGLFFGVLLTLILEGFLLINGHTAITSLLGWKNAPKPISTVLDLGKEKLTNVLGMEANNPTSTDAIKVLQSLNVAEIKKVKAIICEP